MGSSRTLSYTVVGDTVNTASRLCSHATPGEILVSDPIKDALEGRLEYSAGDDATMKGKARPVPIYRVTGIS